MKNINVLELRFFFTEISKFINTKIPEIDFKRVEFTEKNCAKVLEEIYEKLQTQSHEVKFQVTILLARIYEELPSYDGEKKHFESIKLAKNNLEKVKALNTYVRTLMFSRYDFVKAKEVFDESTKILVTNESKLIQIEFLGRKGVGLKEIDDEIKKLALEVRNNEKDDELYAESINAYYVIDKSNPKQAYLDLKKAYKLIPYPYKHKILSCIANIALANGQFSRAHKLYNLRLEISLKYGMDKGVVYSYFFLGYIETELKNYTLGKEYYQKSLEHNLNTINSDIISTQVFTNLGLIYKNIEEFEESLKYYRLGYEHSKKIGNEGFMQLSIQNMNCLIELINQKSQKVFDEYEFQDVEEQYFNKESENLNKKFILKVLEKNQNNILKAAKSLEMPVENFVRKMKYFRIELPNQ
ncbi:MAG: tetratricopeptide repeat protein [Calditrichaeota bacterium]|nr:MAG: tetratricopeptide repeat protein [Calditrichota bacterium]